MEIAIGMTVRTNNYEEFVGNVPKKIYGEVVDIMENVDGDIKVFLKVTDRIRYWYNLSELEAPNGEGLTYRVENKPKKQEVVEDTPFDIPSYQEPQEEYQYDNDDLPF